MPDLPIVTSASGTEPDIVTLLHEAEATLEAIRNGEVDAFVMKEGDEDQVFVVRGAYRPYRVFVEQMKEGAATLSPDGIILYANQAFGSLVKTPLAQVVGAPIDNFVLNKSALQSFLEPNDIRSLELELQASDGTVVPVYVSYSAVRSREKSWICLIVIDLSEQKCQQAMLQQNERLAAMGMTAAVLSHEIANPLTSISATVQLMQRQVAQSSPVQQFAENLRVLASEVNRLAELLEDFRSLSHPTQLTLVPTSLGDLIAESVNVIAPVAAEAAVEIEHEISADLSSVSVDQKRMKQVILNLCKNAIEAMPNGGKLVIKAARHEGDVIIEIADSGMGISEDIDIFELFTTTKSTGTGLGLGIVRQIVAAHGGTIRYSSNPGQGTTFYVSLPLGASRRPAGSI